MNCRFLSVGAAVLTVAVVNVRVDAVTVTIEHGTEYQTMLGFGGHDPRGDVSTLVNDLGMSVHRAEIRPDGYNGPNYATFGGMHPWWTNGPFYTVDFLKLIIDTIGFSIIRTEFYPRPDQADMFTKQIPFLRAVLQKSDESGADVRIIASVWTPPASIKDNNSTTAGSLRDGQESALADYLVTYLQYYKEQVGRDLFALSPQNEPQIGTGYNSCPYWPAQLAEVIVALGPKVKTANLPTRVFFSDDICCWYDWNNQVQTGIQGNRVADSVASIRAMHYAADDDNGSIQVFQQYGTGARQLGKQAWNTEFGNGSDSWDGAAWKNTKDMYYMLRYGYSGIVYWLIGPHTNASQGEESVMYNLRRGPKAYAAQAFARFIRPNARRVDCTSADQQVLALAFKHQQHNTVTVILVNNSTSAKDVTVSGTGLPASFDVYKTGPAHNCVKDGTVAAGGTVQIPARTIFSLYNTPEPVGVRPARLSAASTAAVTPAAARSYGLDGRIDAGRRGTGVFFRSGEAGSRLVRRSVLIME